MSIGHSDAAPFKTEMKEKLSFDKRQEKADLSAVVM